MTALAALRMRNDRRGIAAAEFALVATGLFLIIASIVDIGNAIQQRMLLQQALRAGGQYALTYPTHCGGCTIKDDGVEQAIGKALPWAVDGSNVTVSVTQCLCADPGAPAACGGVCGGGTGSYMVMSAARASSPILIPTGNCTAITGNCASYVVRFQ